MEKDLPFFTYKKSAFEVKRSNQIKIRMDSLDDSISNQSVLNIKEIQQPKYYNPIVDWNSHDVLNDSLQSTPINHKMLKPLERNESKSIRKIQQRQKVSL